VAPDAEKCLLTWDDGSYDASTGINQQGTSEVKSCHTAAATFAAADD